MSAQKGVGVVMRQTLYGYYYSLLDIDMNPNPVRIIAISFSFVACAFLNCIKN